MSYDFNYAVVGTSHALHIREHVPAYWGVITVEIVDGEFDFYILRRPEPNPKVTWKRKLEILWRPELAQIQDLNQMPKYKEKSKIFVKDRIIERLEAGKIEETALKKQVSEILLERDYNTISEMLTEFRKSEIAKKLEKEENPERQIELMTQRIQARKNFRNRGRRKRNFK